ncbi:MAG: hypothetical protein WBD27_07450 [Pyrinomonadaceae bacterium]
MFQPFDKLQIITIQQILDGARMNLPLMEEVTKKAQKAKKTTSQRFYRNNSASLVHEVFLV